MSSHADTIRNLVPHTSTQVLGSHKHPDFCKGCEAEAALDALLAENQQLREEILRCGALAISERADGCVPKTRALQIRKVAYELTSREALAGDAE